MISPSTHRQHVLFVLFSFIVYAQIFHPLSCRRFSLNYANEPNEFASVCGLDLLMEVHIPKIYTYDGSKISHFCLLSGCQFRCFMCWFFSRHSLNFSAQSSPAKFKFDGIVLQISTHTHTHHVCDAAYGICLHIAVELNLSVIYVALGVCAVAINPINISMVELFNSLDFMRWDLKGFVERKNDSFSQCNKQTITEG